MTLIAINILLEPDAATAGKAKAINARLRENYPDGFPLDANHAPHITILQLFIKTVDLGPVADAVSNVLRREPLINLKGKATGYFQLASKNLKLLAFSIEATPDQHRLQQKIFDAIAPFAVKHGTSDAFAPRLDNGAISQATVDYVTSFSDERIGPNYQPHLTLGIGTSDFVDALVAEPFEAFTIQTASVSLYQIGDYGVAQTKLYDFSHQVDPLPSWNEGYVKQAIFAFIAKVTNKDSSAYLPPAERIAVHDNDGTLWPENPLPFQAAFAIDELRQRILTDPSLTSNPMVQAALGGDLAKLLEGEHFDGLMQILALTHAGMTVEEFQDAVAAWFRSSNHPRYGRAYGELTYQPMQELLRYLSDNGFKNFIVSGGGADFMRVWVEQVYGIPPEQVVGSTSRAIFELRDGKPVITKTLDYMFVNDKAGKPVGIHQFIGRRPIFCSGNSDGDHAMLQYTTINNPRPSLGLIIHHTDAEREYAYDAKTNSTGKLVEALKEAAQQGWLVVDMKQDWKVIFQTQ